MRSVSGRLAARLLHASGVSDRLCRRAGRRGRSVVMLHGVSSHHRPDLPAAAQPFLDASDLARILAWLGERFRLLTADELLSAISPGVLVTFDDGYANNHDQALPLLRAHDAPAVLFVTTRHVADPHDWLPSIRRQLEGAGVAAEEISAETARDLYDGMSPAELARCAASPGVEIGSHTVDHPSLPGLDGAALARELEESKRLLEDWTGRPVDLFAYPSGDYDRRVALATERAGYHAAFADGPRGLAPSARFEIPRIGLYAAEPWYLAAKLSGLFRRPLPLGTGDR